VIKLLIFAGIVIGALKFTPLGDLVWAKTISVVNPSAIEEPKAIEEISSNIKDISRIVNNSSSISPSEKKKLQILISSTNSSLEKVADIANKKDITAAISEVVENFLGSTPDTGLTCP